MAEVKEVKLLKRRRSNLKGTLTKFNNFLVENVNEASMGELESRLQRAEKTLEEFSNLTLQLEEMDEEVDYTEESDNFEGDYHRIMGLARDTMEIKRETKLQKAMLEVSQVQMGDNINVRLPTIDLPNFDGTYEGWFHFKDTFRALIENNSTLSDVQKYYYLNSCLKGKARQILTSLEISGENYKLAWDLLKRRYENTKLIKNAHVTALFELPVVIKESYGALRSLIDEFVKRKGALEALKLPVQHWDVLLIHLVTSKLDSTTRKAWEEASGAKEDTTIDQLTDFLNERCMVLEAFNRDKSPKLIAVSKSAINTPLYAKTCDFCLGEHVIYKCTEFLKLSINERANKVRELSLCWRCLKKGHVARDCRGDGCFICKRSHNKLLHVDNKGTIREEKITTHCQAKNGQVMLSTAVVSLRDKYGNFIQARAMLDVGSDSNFVSKALLRRLKLTKTDQVDISITGMGCKTSKINKRIELLFKSVCSNFSAKLNFLVIDKITRRLPIVELDRVSLNLPENIRLADPTFDTPGDIDLLLGAEIFYELLTNQKNNLSNGTVLQGSRLGWLVTGIVGSRKCTRTTISNLAVGTEALKQQLERFWQIEEVEGHEDINQTRQTCEKNFVDSVGRANDGKFEVHLPRRHDVGLGSTEQMALRRFYNLERRLDKNKILKDDYVKFMTEYEELGHMEKAKEKIEGETYYIPHHPIYKKNSSTTKLRVVFDASAKSSNGKSLNDILMVGPVIQSDLFTILLRFRTHNIALIADIEKMYRQVWVHPEYLDLQRIFWRESSNLSVQKYRLKTLTYGTAPASFLATRCLIQLAAENNEKFPEAAQIIKEDFYMDDLITGGKDIEIVKNIRKSVELILSEAGFNLRKFCSNATEVLEDLDYVTDSHVLRNENDNRALGVIWNANNDEFTFHVDADDSKGEASTKRIILSTISRIFDPLGIVAPIVVMFKMFLQKLWSQTLGWDDEIPTDMKTSWLNIRQGLPHLNKLKIPRVVLLKTYTRLELHGFSDASEKAYGAAIYMKTTNDCSEVMVSLICAKSRVAPLQQISLPRLELCGAVLLTRLMRSVERNIRMNVDAVHYWTDSMIVLGWIRGEISKWKTFVANRVSAIQVASNNSQWHHISGRENPADIVSRGSTVDALMKSEWYAGPSFLYTTVEYKEMDNYETDVELRIPVVTHVSSSCMEWDIFSRFSGWSKLKRVMGWILRFVNNAKGGERVSGTLSVRELNHSENVLIKLVQGNEFIDEVRALRRSKQVASSSRLLRLYPFLDVGGIIRVGGRLSNALLSYEAKYPVVLPKGHRLTELIIHAEHMRLMHAGPQAVLASLRQRYWPLSGRDVVRTIIRKCVVCFKANPVGPKMLMGDLPYARLRPIRPFFNIALDYAGPFLIKDGKLRNRKWIKCYLCVFVCFVTRAVHLELVTELSTSSFLQVLNRFIARRGMPRHIYSDNGTNFVGAWNELKSIKIKLASIANDDRWKTYLAENSIEWHFMPARSPHFGGLHEAAVKSAKRHLLRVVGNAKLTYEQLYTIVCQTEGILNSRPIIPSSNDPTDLAALTPGHFLIGDNLNAIPGDQTTSSCKLQDFRRMQELISHFWNRWCKEYLQSLQQRSKWSRKNSTNVKVGAMVLLRDDNSMVQQWRLGRIINVIPGRDGVIRVVDVKTSTGQTRRAVATICPLPIEAGDSD